MTPILIKKLTTKINMKYRKKPVIIEAIKYNSFDDKDAIKQFCPEAIELHTGEFLIETLEGDMYLSKGSYLIRGVKGEFYPCKPDIFELTYDSIGVNRDYKELFEKAFPLAKELLEENKQLKKLLSDRGVDYEELLDN